MKCSTWKQTSLKSFGVLLATNLSDFLLSGKTQAHL